jgi:queuine tRNA-ribosyltransferase
MAAGIYFSGESDGYQRSIGADIIMAFDECPPGGSDFKYAKKSMDLTHRWLDRCFNQFNATGEKYGYTQNFFQLYKAVHTKNLEKNHVNTLFQKMQLAMRSGD